MGPWFLGRKTCFPSFLGTEEFTSKLESLYLMSLPSGQGYKQRDNRKFGITGSERIVADGHK